MFPLKNQNDVGLKLQCLLALSKQLYILYFWQYQKTQNLQVWLFRPPNHLGPRMSVPKTYIYI